MAVDEETNRRRVAVELQTLKEWKRRGGNCCSSCKGAVFFVMNRGSGRWQIVDATPNWSKGNMDLVFSPEGRRERGDALFIDHHATCKYVERHR